MKKFILVPLIFCLLQFNSQIHTFFNTTGRIIRHGITSTVTEPWGEFLTRITQEVFKSDKIRLGKGIIDQSFRDVRYYGISPSRGWLNMLVRHIWYQLYRKIPSEHEIIPLILAIYQRLREYEFENFIDSETLTVTYQKKSEVSFAVEEIDPEDIELEQVYLESQKANPVDLDAYITLKEIYEELLEKYPKRLYYYWQLSWVYSILGKYELRKVVFLEGAKKEMRPLPEYAPRFRIAEIIYKNRENFFITWGDYGNSNQEYLRAHALKYYMQFPEVFMPEGENNPILPRAWKRFTQAVSTYGERAKEIIKEDGTEFYAFYKNDMIQFLAYRPDSQEVVGFRMRLGRWNNWEVAIDTFYKASPGMVESLKEEGIIELLIDSGGNITVPYDDQPYPFRIYRRPEQIEEFKFFGLNNQMYQPIIQKIEEIIKTRSRKRVVIMIAGTTAAGKSPGAEIIQAYLAERGRKSVVLPMDLYFIDRDLTPIRNGHKDYDSPKAINIERFKEDVIRLLKGEEIELPRYDFESGESIPHSGIKLQLEPGDFLIIEGIHALNPDLTGFIRKLKIDRKKVPQVGIFIDASQRLRFARRLVRDWVTRGIEPIQTIRQWENVRYGEDNYIYPTLEYADVRITTELSKDEFQNSELYEIFREGLKTALQQAKLEENVELIQYITDLMENYFGPVIPPES